jgi:RNA polymerase sigma factor (sigma-70 family)
MSTKTKSFLATRESLLERLKNWEDQTSWREFYDTYWRLIYGVASKSGLSEVEAEDVLQETLVAVANKIKEFEYDPSRGRFKGWLLTLTRWQIATQFRKRQRLLPMHQTEEGRSESDGKTSFLERLPDPATVEVNEKLWDAEWERNLMARAIECVRELVEPRTFQMFQLYVQQDWPVRRVAKTLGVSCTQVYVAKHRISALLKKEIERLERIGSQACRMAFQGISARPKRERRN